MKNNSIFGTITKLGILVIMLVSFSVSNAQSQTRPFDVKLFQSELQAQMKVAFPYAVLDTATLYPILYAADQHEAGAPSCYGTHSGKYINAEGDEHQLAVDAVKAYKEYLINRIFLKESAIKTCGTKTFCAIAVKEGGLIHYEMIIDNQVDIMTLSLDKEY